MTNWFTLSPICWLLNMEDKEFAFYHPFLIFPLPSLPHYKCRYILSLVSFIFHIYVMKYVIFHVCVMNTNHSYVNVYIYIYIIIIAESSNCHNCFSFPAQYYFPYTLFYHLVRLFFYLLLTPYSYSLRCWHLMTCGNMLTVLQSFSWKCRPWDFWPSPIWILCPDLCSTIFSGFFFRRLRVDYLCLVTVLELPILFFLIFA